VATYSTGITVTWNSFTFKEVYGLSWQYGAPRQDRAPASTTGWVPEPGNIAFSCFAADGVTTANIGKRGPVTIAGGGMTYNGDAVLESVFADAELNGVTRYTVTLKAHT
jgi:hypothetical protein